MIELPYYVWVALGVIVGINILLEKYYWAWSFHDKCFPGVILLYVACLRVSTNDWIGTIPPGPRQVPYFGCLFYLLSMKTNLDVFLSRYFLQFGAVVRFSICRFRIVLVDGSQNLELKNNELLGKQWISLCIGEQHLIFLCSRKQDILVPAWHG